MTANFIITLNVSGVLNDDLDFTYESGVSLNWGCAVTLQGRMLYLGGRHGFERQVRFEAILQIEIIYS